MCVGAHSAGAETGLAASRHECCPDNESGHHAPSDQNGHRHEDGCQHCGGLTLRVPEKAEASITEPPLQLVPVFSVTYRFSIAPRFDVLAARRLAPCDSSPPMPIQQQTCVLLV